MNDDEPHSGEIRVIAYLKWLDAGQPEGNDLHFWDEAKREFYEVWVRDYPNGNYPFMEIL